MTANLPKKTSNHLINQTILSHTQWYFLCLFSTLIKVFVYNNTFFCTAFVASLMLARAANYCFMMTRKKDCKGSLEVCEDLLKRLSYRKDSRGNFAKPRQLSLEVRKQLTSYFYEENWQICDIFLWSNLVEFWPDLHWILLWFDMNVFTFYVTFWSLLDIFWPF